MNGRSGKPGSKAIAEKVYENRCRKGPPVDETSIRKEYARSKASKLLPKGWSPIARQRGLTVIFALAVLSVILLAINPTLCFAILLGAIICAVTLASPYAGLLIFLAFLFIRPAERIIALESLHAHRLFTMCFLFSWLVERRLRRRTVSVPRHQLLTVFFAGAIVMLFSSITAMWKSNSFNYTLEFFLSVLFCMATIDLLNSQARIRGYIGLLLGLALFMSIEQLVNYHLLEATSATESVRAGGVGSLFGNSNDFALAMVFFFPFAYYATTWARSNTGKIAVGIIAFSLVASIAATGSRGGAVGIAAIFIVFFVHSQRKLAAGAGLALLLIIMWLLTPDFYKGRLETMPAYSQDTNAMIRINAWKAGGRMFMHNPILGVGPGNFEDAFYRGGFGQVYKDRSWRAAHSMYVQTMAELGLAGLVWLFALVAAIIRTLLRIRKTLREAETSPPFLHSLTTSMEAGFVGFLVGGAFLSVLYYPYFMLFCGLAAAVERISAAEAAPEPVAEYP